ncbi:hypothetical protein [Pedobacter sp. MC2016-24]|uniref:hypothetical protein n=1 Tax=Pedobacter sp. MC2016-24 TaxID=2780090 RepID=UPI00187DDFAA|nr:hypothetical protein [Pedobacter sp. MC2016-24]MBE9601669.1 hypothetical protein [Pedobacter sp. MC2016-24]
MKKINLSRVKPIGGYLDLQLNKSAEFYPLLLKLNTGRNAFEYILKVRGYKTVFIPYFTCEVLLEPLRKLGISYQFYTINEAMDPVIDFEPGDHVGFLYTNYFGLKGDTIKFLSKQYKNLIVDNSQAFFSEPLPGVDTFYSCRKFFGVPDGAYLHMDSQMRLKLERDHSLGRFSHLITSIDQGIESGYAAYLENNVSLSNNPIRGMSLLTNRILSGVDYKTCRYRRNSNFMFLHEVLGDINHYSFDASSLNGPMVYPFVSSSKQIKQRLLENRIYVATYWPNVLDWTTKKMFEHYLTNHLTALPIDHRYTHIDMRRILNVLKPLL